MQWASKANGSGNKMADETIDTSNDCMEVGGTKLTGVRTFALALIALLGYIGTVFMQIDSPGMKELVSLAFAFFFAKTLVAATMK
jgi:hypothetical protein